MPLLSFRLLIYLSLVGMIASAGLGLYTYFSYVDVLKEVPERATIEDALRGVKRLEYTLRDGDSVYRVVVNNDPESKRGAIEVYSGGTLLYILEYEYSGNRLVSLVNVTANRTTLDPIEYEEAFATSVYFSQDITGAIQSVEAFPGIGPLFSFQYVSNSLAVDWESVLDPRGATSPFDVIFTTIDSPLGSYRGVEATLHPGSPVLVPSKWAEFFTLFQVAEVDGYVITLRFSMTGALGAAEVEVSYEVLSLEAD